MKTIHRQITSSVITSRAATPQELDDLRALAPSVAVATIAGTHWHPSVESTLTELTRVGVTVLRGTGSSDIVLARSVLATELLDAHPHIRAILWIDSDTALHPVDCLRMLSSCLEPGPGDTAPGCLLSAVSPARGGAALLPVWDPSQPDTVIKLGGEPTRVPIRAAGFGCVAHPRAVLEDLAGALERCRQGFIPFFLPVILSGWYLSEDFAFFDRAQAAGWRAYADPSIRVIHWGEYPYHWEDALEVHGRRDMLPFINLHLHQTSDE
jgi:hypothetical protein